MKCNGFMHYYIIHLNLSSCPTNSLRGIITVTYTPGHGLQGGESAWSGGAAGGETPRPGGDGGSDTAIHTETEQTRGHLVHSVILL